MHQHSLKRLLSVSLLAGGLAFLGPIQVHAAPVAGPQAVWKWLTRAWEETVPVLWGRASPQWPTWQKQGSPKPATTTVGPRCLSTEQGPCIDPNG